MKSPEPTFRLHGQARMRTVGLTLGALAFILSLHFVASTSAAPNSLGVVTWAFHAATALCFVGFVRAIWHAFAPRVDMTIAPYPLVIGNTVRFEWELGDEATRVAELRVEAHFLGARFDRHGQRVNTPTRVPLVEVKGPDARRGTLEVELPSDLVPTRKNRGENKTFGRWTLELRARVEGAPGVHESYSVQLTHG